jgi:hypothetical protein
MLDVGEDARRAFLRAHSMLSAAVIESCVKAIEHFVDLRAQRLPVLIREHDPRINQFLSTLHMIRRRAEHDADLQAMFRRNDKSLSISRSNGKRSRPHTWLLLTELWKSLIRSYY